MRLATKLRRFAINLTLVLASTLVVLGVLEVLARLIYKDEGLGPIFPAPGEAQAILQKSAIAGLRYEYIPGSTKYNCYPDNPRGYFDPDNCIRYFINAQGFRGPEVSQRKPAGVFRILGLGDSFMLGVGVRDEDTYLRRLERLLNRSGRGKFEVLNFGVEGYNTEDEASLFAGRGVEYDPDLVLVGYFLNDTGLSFNYWVQRRLWPGLRRYSRLWELVARRIQLTLLTRSLIRRYHQEYLPNARGWQKVQTSLFGIQSLCREHHFRLLVVILPVLYKLDDSYPFLDLHAKVREFCAQNGIPVLDLFPAFKGQPAQDLWVYPTDQHPNERGHQIIAQAIYQYLLATFPERPGGG